MSTKYAISREEFKQRLANREPAIVKQRPKVIKTVKRVRAPQVLQDIYEHVTQKKPL